MSLTVFYDSDIDLSPVLNKTLAIIGYGAQGRPHALNLRDSGLQVVVGQRKPLDTSSAAAHKSGYQQAMEDGFEPVPISTATERADFICLMLPDEVQKDVFEREMVDFLSPGDYLLCCHGFSFLYEQVIPPAGTRGLLVAPKGAGHRVRSAYEQGSGVPSYCALGPQATEEDWPIALAYAKAIGSGRVGVMQATVREETETDLFGEQTVLCGGVSELCRAAFDTLVEAGYPPEMAYFECVHELKLVVDLLHQGGLGFMHHHISNTAEFGDYTRGPRIIDEQTRERMRQVLQEIQNGQFAREWIEETARGGQAFQEMREERQRWPLEKTGSRVNHIVNGRPLPPNDET